MRGQDDVTRSLEGRDHLSDGTKANNQMWALAPPDNCVSQVSVSGLILGFELKRRPSEEGVNVEVRVVPAHVRG